MTLRQKLLMTLVPVLIFPLLIVGGSSWLYMREAGIRLLNAQLEESLQRAEQALQAVIQSTHATMELLAQHDLTRRYLGLPEANRYAIAYRPMINLFNQHMQVKPALARIAVLDQQGRMELVAERTGDIVPVSPVRLRELYAGKPARTQWLQRDAGSQRMYFVAARKVVALGQALDMPVTADSFRGYVIVMSELPVSVLRPEKEAGELPLVLHLVDAAGKIQDSTLDMPGIREHQKMSARILESSLTRVHAFGEGAFWGGYRRLTDGLFLTGVMEGRHVAELTQPLATSIWVIVALTAAGAMLILWWLAHVHVLAPVRQIRYMIDLFKTSHALPEAITDRHDELGAIQRALHELLDGLLSSYERINQLSRFDLLTGLPNRQTFTQILEGRIRDDRSPGPGRVIALVHLDVDGFKFINDAYGHQAGDQLLKQMAERLEQLMGYVSGASGSPCRDMAARLGGDQFAVLLDGLSQAHQASLAAARIQDVLTKPYDLGGHTVNITISMGIALYPVDGETADQLLKSADLALFESKQKGKGGYQFFTEALNVSAHRRLELEQALREGLQQHQFEVWLQPKVDLVRGVATGYEALVRWRHPERGMMPPAAFIPVAEETGLINDLGREVLYLGCRALVEVRKRLKDTTLTLAVNLSPRQLTDDGLIDYIQETLQYFGLQGRDLEFEVTESILMEDRDQAWLVMSDLHALGATIALDDFGTGYSSLSYLRQFPFDVVKIDRSFVMELDEKDEAGHIVEAICRLILDLDKKVVAEGVETPGQLRRLQQCGVHLAQGYLFDKPKPADEAERDYRVHFVPASPGRDE